MNDVNQPLRELFDAIDAAELAAMQSRREEESLQLDFKRMDVSGEPSDADKRNLRESISGFANAAGGIILWGIESKTPEDRQDRSRFQSIVPVRNGERAVVRFHELTGVATQPPVSGVVHRAIAVDGGFVVKTFVPASDGGPHRTNEERGQYFRRDADAFRAMQHHEIADMFGRRARPRLELWWQRVFGDERLRLRRIESAWILGLRNIGRGLARFPCLSMTVRPAFAPMTILDLDATGGGGASGLPQRRIADNQVQTVLFAGGGNDVIHPGQTLHVTRFGLGPGDNLCVVDYQLFAEG